MQTPEHYLNIAIGNFILNETQKRAIYDYVTCNIGIDEETQDFDSLVDIAICELYGEKSND